MDWLVRMVHMDTTSRSRWLGLADQAFGQFGMPHSCLVGRWHLITASLPAIGGRDGPWMATVLTVGKFITRMRPGDRELGDRIVAEAHRLFESGAPTSEAISTLIAIAGDNPNSFMAGKKTRGLNKSPEGRAILRLVGTASMVRDYPGTAVGSGWWPPGD